ncbi:MAG: hypothetical protein ACFCU1_02160 [Sumerlaeia bacterium]
MPRKIYTFTKAKPLYPDLVERLASEINKESVNEFSDEDEILIREERTPYDTYHITVSWDVWKNIEKDVRGRIILDSYERALGETEANKITLVLGLTKAEAKEVNIEF